LYGNFEFFSLSVHLFLFFLRKRMRKRRERVIEGNPVRNWRDLGGNFVI